MSFSFPSSARKCFALVIGYGVTAVAMAAGQNPPSAPVTVVNTSANPMPVTGTMTVTGTSNVNVTNSSIPVTGTVGAQQVGTWTVGLGAGSEKLDAANTLLTALKAILTQLTFDNTGNLRVVQESSAASAPLRFQATATSPNWGLHSFNYVVPTGKRLIIQYMNGSGGIDGGNVSIRLFVGGSPQLEYSLPLLSQGNIFLDLYVGSAQVNIVAEAGEALMWSCDPSDGNKNGNCVFNLVANLVDAN